MRISQTIEGVVGKSKIGVTVAYNDNRWRDEPDLQLENGYVREIGSSHSTVQDALDPANRAQLLDFLEKVDTTMEIVEKAWKAAQS